MATKGSDATKRAEQCALVLQAFAEGKTIQVRERTNCHDTPKCPWEDSDTPSWNFAQYEYRIKPRTATAIVVFTEDGQPADVYTPAKDVQAAAHCARINGYAIQFSMGHPPVRVAGLMP